MQEIDRQELNSPIVCFETSSVATGYRLLDILTRENSVRVLEASCVGAGRFMVLATGEATVLRESERRVRETFDGVGANLIVDHELIEEPTSELLHALFSLSQVQAEAALVVIETDSVSGLLSVASQLTHGHGLKAIEMKVSRGGKGGGYGFFTGSQEACAPAAEDVRTRLKSALREGVVELIDNPSRSFREFFNFSGEV